MIYTRLQLQTDIYNILQKEVTAYGLLTPTKVQDAIQDALDWVSSNMLGSNSSWLSKIIYVDIIASLTIQDLTYTPTPSARGYGYTIGYTNGALLVTLTGKALNVRLATGVTTAAQVKAAVDAFFVTNPKALFDVTVTGTGTTAQTSPVTAQLCDTCIAYPADAAIVNFIKRKSNLSDTTYIELQYKETNKETINNDVATGIAVSAESWMFANGSIYLEPAPAVNVTDGIMLNYLAYPARLASDSDNIPGEINGTAFVQYAKWRAAMMLYQLANDATPPWAKYEQEWFALCMKIIGKKNAMPLIIPGIQNY